MAPARPYNQITTPTPHHSIFTGRMLFLTPITVWSHVTYEFPRRCGVLLTGILRLPLPLPLPSSCENHHGGQPAHVDNPNANLTPNSKPKANSVIHKLPKQWREQEFASGASNCGFLSSLRPSFDWLIPPMASAFGLQWTSHAAASCFWVFAVTVTCEQSLLFTQIDCSHVLRSCWTWW